MAHDPPQNLNPKKTWSLSEMPTFSKTKLAHPLSLLATLINVCLKHLRTLTNVTFTCHFVGDAAVDATIGRTEERRPFVFSVLFVCD